MACYTNTFWSLDCSCGATDIQYYDCSGVLQTIDPATCGGNVYQITYSDDYGFPVQPTCDINYVCNCVLTQQLGPSPSTSATPSVTPTPSLTPTPTPTPTSSLTPTPTPSPSRIPGSPSITPSRTPAPSISLSPRPPSPTPTRTSSVTPTPTPTRTPSITPTRTPSVIPASPTPSPSRPPATILWAPSSSNVSNVLVMWLDAADANAMVLSGNSVVRWKDKSLSGSDATQLTSFRTPTLSANFQNSLSGISFNGYSSFFTIVNSVSSQLNAQTLSVYYVAQYFSVSRPIGTIIFSNRGYAPLPDTGRFIQTTRSNDSNKMWAGQVNRVNNEYLTLTFNGTSAHIISFYNSVFPFTLPSPASSQLLRCNGGMLSGTTVLSATEVSNPGSINGYFAGVIPYSIGAYGIQQDGSPGTHHYDGMLGEIIAFTRPYDNDGNSITPTVEGYLAWKWGLQYALPNDHQFKNAAPTIASSPLPSPSPSITPTPSTTPQSVIPWVPSNNSALALWLDAADASTLTLSGSDVTTWKDKSLSGNDATQTLGARLPTLSANWLNGLSGIAFNGTVDFLTIASSISAGGGLNDRAATILYVAQSNTNTGTDRIVISNRSDVPVVGTGRFVRSPTSAGATFVANAGNANTLTLTYNTTSAALISWGNSRTANYSVLRYNGGTLSARNLTDSTYNISNSAYNIGRDPGAATDYYNGRIGEILIYNAPLTGLQLAQPEGYLAWKWGLQYALPADHQFKNAAPTIPASPLPSPSISLTPSITPSVTPSATPSVTPPASILVSFSLTPSTTPSRTPSVTPSVTPTPPFPTKSPAPTPSLTRTPAPSFTPLIGVTNESNINFSIYDLNDILFSSSSNKDTSISTQDKQAYEYVSNTVINKALLKLMVNNRTLTKYLNYKFTGTLNPETNEVTSGDIIPLTKEEKDLINFIYTNECFVNVNEKTAPQVLTRAFQCLYESGNVVSKLTNIDITNLESLISTLNFIEPIPSPTVTPTITPSKTPSITVSPQSTVTPTITPSPTRTPSVTPTPTPSISITPTIPLSPVLSPQIEP